jgi:hypothetical protein
MIAAVTIHAERGYFGGPVRWSDGYGHGREAVVRHDVGVWVALVVWGVNPWMSCEYPSFRSADLGGNTGVPKPWE